MELELFYRKDCPFSAKVRRYIAAEGLKSQIEFHDLDEEVDSEDQLLKLTGDEQVPCLVVDGKPILESDDIIDFLDEHKDELKPIH